MRFSLVFGAMIGFICVGFLGSFTQTEAKPIFFLMPLIMAAPRQMPPPVSTPPPPPPVSTLPPPPPPPTTQSPLALLITGFLQSKLNQFLAAFNPSSAMAPMPTAPVMVNTPAPQFNFQPEVAAEAPAEVVAEVAAEVAVEVPMDTEMTVEEEMSADVADMDVMEENTDMTNSDDKEAEEEKGEEEEEENVEMMTSKTIEEEADMTTMKYEYRSFRDLISGIAASGVIDTETEQPEEDEEDEEAEKTEEVTEYIVEKKVKPKKFKALKYTTTPLKAGNIGDLTVKKYGEHSNEKKTESSKSEESKDDVDVVESSKSTGKKDKSKYKKEN